ncbi:hypothetical protein LTR04_006582 [Oleoguttula sp. CCFEE 6159]|nr:hypothetical protein LTR04_006582 [Oleoguttula sp. CCFEE 6159]
MSSVPSRKEEILAKRAKLAEIKRQRELRLKELSTSRLGISDSSELASPTPSRANNREELDSLISSLVDRPSSTAPRESSSPIVRGSRPTSAVGVGQVNGVDCPTVATPPPLQAQTVGTSTQTLSIAPLTTVYEFPADPRPEILTYSKAVQTSAPWSPQRHRSSEFSDSDDGRSPSKGRSQTRKHLSRRERERDEEYRQNIRQEIEEELKALRLSEPEADAPSATLALQNFPARTLTNEELNAVTSSNDFLDFVEKSSKVVERALDEEYDLLADYALSGLNSLEDDDDEDGMTHGKKGRRIREAAQFYDERWSKRRMISDINFSPKHSELLLAAYTKNVSAPNDPPGILQVWNAHMPSRPEYLFTSTSDILTAKFSPYHPNLIVGGAYSGQVLLWDTRSRSIAPVQKTPLTGVGHTHPVYSLEIVGTQNANNIISCSTDGVVCGWSVDMLSVPQEYLELAAPAPSKTEDIAPTCIAFPHSDPTYFLAGTEEGSIYPCHRYDRAGAKAGIDQKLKYAGHAAPVMSLDFHPSRGPSEFLGDLALSNSVDWLVKLWKVRAPAATASSAVNGGPDVVLPLHEFVREDLVYDARWNPVKPGVFALVDGAGSLEIWDIGVDIEVPIAKTSTSSKLSDRSAASSLNKLAWEKHEGKRVAVGGRDGVVTVFEVGADLGGLDNVRTEDWVAVKKVVNQLGGGDNGV